ncbi:DUF4279 domain-containing protein [Pseudoxanthomonas sp. PXM01]|uniref:DUF4279 domain-containing protein n=1 Tax=Pseudoxanthomonas sp. PXM01 TaxID=2769295 RepID=UPI00178518DD|nr:DUF4279 domain-containing protein [Pseudoxanthomonas sp. PXM01]MBD9470821.1 DUF4279 domain-containing protein [Pseudoxanthomonas sp. PXM01]
MEDDRPYGYEVSLKIEHPSMHPVFVTAALAMEPKVAWAVGEPLRDRHGTVVPGVREQSYWLHSFGEGDDNLTSFLQEIVSRLEPHAAFFHELGATGGGLQLFVGYFVSAPNTHVALDPDLMARCAALGAHLYLDIYA